MPSDSGAVTRQVNTHSTSGTSRRDDQLIAEIPCELRYNGKPFGVMMLTPVNLRDFAIGFSLSEGILDNVSLIESVTITELFEGILIDVTAPLVAEFAERLLPSRSGCGLCGTRRLEDAVRDSEPLPGDTAPVISPVALARAVEALPSLQTLNALTGAAHAAAWVSTDGDILEVREDVGRHNALDKLLGHLSASGADFSRGFVLVTSRASFEMVSKAVRLRVPTLAAISAPTALAADFARRHHLQLIAFARAGSFNTYSD